MYNLRRDEVERCMVMVFYYDSFPTGPWQEDISCHRLVDVLMEQSSTWLVCWSFPAGQLSVVLPVVKKAMPKLATATRETAIANTTYIGRTGTQEAFDLVSALLVILRGHHMSYGTGLGKF